MVRLDFSIIFTRLDQHESPKSWAATNDRFPHPRVTFCPQVEATLRRAMQPNVNNVSLVWGAELKAIHIPGELPPIFMGERMITYAVVKGTGRKVRPCSCSMRLLCFTTQIHRFQNTFVRSGLIVQQADAELEVELLGSLKGKEIRHKMKFIMRSDPTDVAPIHRLAAKAKIKELEIDEGDDSF